MNNSALTKSSLLTKPWEFNRVYRLGKRLRGKHFSLIYTPGDGQENRLGISINGKLKGAAKRNRIKRIIKEFYRHNRYFLQEINYPPRRQTDDSKAVYNTPPPPAMDIVFTVSPGFELKNPAEIKQAVLLLLSPLQKHRPSLMP